MTSMTLTGAKAIPKYAWIILFAFGLLLSLSGLFIFFSGVDTAEFQLISTGIAWHDFVSNQPEAAGYLERITRLLGIGFFGFALLGVIVTYASFRKGERWAWFALWSIPVVHGLTTAVFIASGSYLAGVYGAAALLSLLALLVPYRYFFPKRP